MRSDQEQDHQSPPGRNRRDRDREDTEKIRLRRGSRDRAKAVPELGVVHRQRPAAGSEHLLSSLPPAPRPIDSPPSRGTAGRRKKKGEGDGGREERVGWDSKRRLRTKKRKIFSNHIPPPPFLFIHTYTHAPLMTSLSDNRIIISVGAAPAPSSPTKPEGGASSSPPRVACRLEAALGTIILSE